MLSRLIAAHDLSARDLAAWEELADRAAEPNPLFEHQCVVAAARHQMDGRGIALLVAEEDHQFYGCLPIAPRSRMGKMPVRTVTTDIRRMTYLGTPLVDEARGGEAMRIILHHLVHRSEVGRARLFEMRWVHADGPVDHHIHQAVEDLGLKLYVAESFERPVVSRRPDGNYQRFNSKYRAVLKRRRRQLALEMGGDLVLEDRTRDPGIVRRFIELEASGYKGTSGVSLASVPGESDYFAEMSSAFAMRGRLQVLTLEAAGRIAAMQLSVRAQDGIFALKTTYDEGLRRWGPGVLLQLGSIEHFHQSTNAQWIDSCTYADNELLLRLYPDRQSMATYVISLGGKLDAGLVAALPTLHAVRAKLRSNRKLRSEAGESDDSSGDGMPESSLSPTASA